MNLFQEKLCEHHSQLFTVDAVLHRSHTGLQDMFVFENRLFGRVLVLDGVVQLTERDNHIYHEMIAHVPLMAHGSAKRVLIIGGGDGGSRRARNAGRAGRGAVAGRRRRCVAGGARGRRGIGKALAPAFTPRRRVPEPHAKAASIRASKCHAPASHQKKTGTKTKTPRPRAGMASCAGCWWRAQRKL